MKRLSHLRGRMRALAWTLGLVFATAVAADAAASGRSPAGESSAHGSTTSGRSATADASLAGLIERLTDRRTDDLVPMPLPEGGVGIDLKRRFQHVPVARLTPDGEATVGCVATLDEANAFFGRDLQTGELRQSSVDAATDPLAVQARRHGMSQTEYQFYSSLIAQHAPRDATSASLLSSAEKIVIVNQDGAGEGFNSTAPQILPAPGNDTNANLGAQRLALFRAAAQIWADFLDTNVPIRVEANFDPITPCDSTGGVLGQAGAANIFGDFPNAEYPNTFYPGALANKRRGADLAPTSPDINTTFNSEVDTGCLGSGTHFYYGLNNTVPSGTVNLLVVLLHELGHGLGSTSFTDASGAFVGDVPDIWSRFMYDRSADLTWFEMTDAERVASSTNTGNLLWDGPNVRHASGFLSTGRDTATGGVELFAPPTFDEGSSVSHFSDAATPNLLMEPTIRRGVTLTLDLTRQQMRDIGWYRDSDADLARDAIGSVAPSGGSVNVGASQTITWSNGGGFTRNVSIELSLDGGATYPITVASNIANTGAFAWTVPNNATAQARLRVREHDFLAPLGQSAANFTIVGSVPAISIDDVSVLEGNSGTQVVTFTASLSQPSTSAVSYSIATANGSATAGSDYVASSLSSQSIPAGLTSKTFAVTINGDTSVEPNETFTVNLSAVVGAVIADGQGTGTIINDDGVTFLSNGVPVPGLAAGTGLQLAFAMTVPAGATGLSFTTTTGSGDADMFVKFGAAPTTLVNDCQSTSPDATESCTFATPQAGTYFVNLQAFTAFSGVTLTGQFTGAPPTANFSYAPSNLVVNFTDTSTSSGGAIAARQWDFGDGTTSTAANPSKTYAAPGTYNVRLTVTDGADGSAAITQAVRVTTPVALLSSDQYLWLVPPESEDQRQGFVRLINRQNVSGLVTVWGVDAAGRRSAGTLTLTLNPLEARQFNSQDLEMGNPDKGLSGALGSGIGDWTVVVRTSLDLEALAYMRTPDGFLTAMHDRVVGNNGVDWWVPFFNPAQNPNQVSHLRLINSNVAPVGIQISGTDDAGVAGAGPVTLTLAGLSSIDLTPVDLESGNAAKGLQGRLGDGDGKWQLQVSADGRITVQSLLADPLGKLTNLSSIADPTQTVPGQYILWLVPPASNKQQQGFVRLINRENRASTVSLRGIDDAGTLSPGTASFTLAANASAQFNSQDLEPGKPEKGLDGELGAGTGNWRLLVTTDLDLWLMGLIRTPDGFVTTVHDVVRGDGLNGQVLIFNPASNPNQVSVLRVVNPNDAAVTVTLQGLDDNGQASGVVSFGLAAGAATELDALDLEGGNVGKGLSGSLGDGSGKWRLSVVASAPVKVMSLLRDPNGFLTDLSSGAKGSSSNLDP